MKVIGITGGTGLIGKRLSKLLAESGYSIIVFTRTPDKRRKYIKHTEYAKWDPRKGTIDTAALARVNALVHLAGESVADKRWTEQRKTEILDSRTTSTKFIVEQLQQYAPDCKVFVATSAIGYYGPDKGGRPFVEDDEASSDFLGHTSQLWEAASSELEGKMRRIILRVGIVLSKRGGAFKELISPFKYGVMPIIGSGEQVVSWIHITDIARMIRFAIERIEVNGCFNAIAPRPVSHNMLMHTIAGKKGQLSIPVPVPSFLLKLFIGQMSVEVLKSCTVSSKKIEEEGFKFHFQDIETAVEQLLKKEKKKKKK